MKCLANKNPEWRTFIHKNARRYATHIPHRYVDSEVSIVPSSDLHSFINCRKKPIIKYEMITKLYPDPPLFVQSSEIYFKNLGMIPNYLGHIPGAKFRCGKTFGVDSKIAKKWLRDFEL